MGRKRKLKDLEGKKDNKGRGMMRGGKWDLKKSKEKLQKVNYTKKVINREKNI